MSWSDRVFVGLMAIVIVALIIAVVRDNDNRAPHN